jgi:hypothetical protein
MVHPSAANLNTLSVPSSASSWVECSMSVNTNVTVPDG